MIDKTVCYKVYEKTKKYRKHGLLLKTFFTRKSAEDFMKKSIFRFIEEDIYIRG